MLDWERDLVDWAYNEDAETEQDEDLIIGLRERWRSLLPCANDPACPNASYILVCADLHLLEFAKVKDRDALNEAVTLLGTPATEAAAEFASLQARRIGYLDWSGPLDSQRAIKAARDLLMQFGEAGDVLVKRETSEELVLSRSTGFRVVIFNKADSSYEVIDRP